MWFNPGAHCWAHWYSFQHVRFSPPELQRSRAWAAQHGGAGSQADPNGDYKMDKNCKQLAPLTPIGKNKSSQIKTRLFRSCALKMFVDDRNLASYNETGCPAAPNIPKARLVFYLERHQLPTSSEWRCERSVGSWRAHQSLHRPFSPTGQCHLGQRLPVLRPHRLPGPRRRLEIRQQSSCHLLAPLELVPKGSHLQQVFRNHACAWLVSRHFFQAKFMKIILFLPKSV